MSAEARADGLRKVRHAWRQTVHAPARLEAANCTQAAPGLAADDGLCRRRPPCRRRRLPAGDGGPGGRAGQGAHAADAEGGVPVHGQVLRHRAVAGARLAPALRRLRQACVHEPWQPMQGDAQPRPVPHCSPTPPQADMQQCCGACEQKVQVANQVVNARCGARAGRRELISDPCRSAAGSGKRSAF